MISGWYLWWIFTLFTMSSGTNLSQVEVSLPSNCSGTIPISSAAVFCFMNMFDWMIGHIIGVLKNEPPCYMDGHCWSWSWNKFLARINYLCCGTWEAFTGLFAGTLYYMCTVPTLHMQDLQCGKASTISMFDFFGWLHVTSLFGIWEKLSTHS